MIENHGLDMEGIFRVPGPAQHIDDLRKAFEDGEYICGIYCIGIEFKHFT